MGGLFSRRGIVWKMMFDARPQAGHKPPWLKVRLPSGTGYNRLKDNFRGLKLHTVCEEARCPNLAECWQSGTATIMILGDVCTRGCRFCAVKTAKAGIPVDRDEPRRVAEALARMELRYVVITSVDRDDLEDGGAGVFADTIRETRRRCPELIIETLIPDFRGDIRALAKVVEAAPQVIGQNIETVQRFRDYEEQGRQLGFRCVAAGPMVRSSYRAAEFFVEKMLA